ncbi:hypothetical protein AEA09_01550 [Lysinibacillus contaminans]|uniref:DUF4145 domain-containing protein n=1 Tax=Lysinibacillus contaminans TaxID=1293441 RepID=A0ABR5K5K0_9BACI|nr:hypothetical protein [Lysinibacillus contaminans]KOS71698.1 hypothetical protein AEA09_01550 [Lysinibacillus contaminans]
MIFDLQMDKDFFKEHIYCYYCERNCENEWFELTEYEAKEKNTPYFGVTDYKYELKRLAPRKMEEYFEMDFPPNIRLSICVCKECGGYWIWENNNIISTQYVKVNNPHLELPSISKELYNDARKIYKLTPRAAAPLLRLAIQELLVHLNLDIHKGTLASMIVELSEKQRAGLIDCPQYIIDGLLKTCVLENDGFASGEVNIYENEENIIILFELINEIAAELIERKRRVEEFTKRLVNK